MFCLRAAGLSLVRCTARMAMSFAQSSKVAKAIKVRHDVAGGSGALRREVSGDDKRFGGVGRMTGKIANGQVFE